jgi:hypothetical protein
MFWSSSAKAPEKIARNYACRSSERWTSYGRRSASMEQWDWLDTGMEPYESSGSVYYGAALAAIAIGSAQGYGNGTDGDVWGGVGRLRSYLRAHYAQQNLYNRTWALLASTRLQGVLSREEAVALAGGLEKMQNADGGWSLYRLGPWTWSKTNPPFPNHRRQGL